jgi:general secretion pathway protein J
MKAPDRGFTLIEVLIALAITAFVSAVAYRGLSAAMLGVERTRETADRTYEINRAWMIISRDLNQFVARPIRDEFGQEEAAMTGGTLANYALSFTRGGWHNPNDKPRSHLQRVAYRLEDGALWRDSWSVLDRAPDSQPQEVKLLQGVEYIELLFLPTIDEAQAASDSLELETRNWRDSWVSEPGQTGAGMAPPAALQLTLQLEDWGEMRRLYALPPL